MRKGQKMSAESRKRMRRTKQARLRRAEIGKEAIQLLITGDIKGATKLAKSSAHLFFLD